MRAAIYLRISEDREGLELGIDRHREDCLALAKQRGWDVVGEFVDNSISARSGKRRPGYQALIAEVRAGRIDRVICWASSRLWRNPRERLDGRELFQKHGIALTPVKGPELDFGSAAGRMVAGILGEVDTAEVDIHSERAKREILQRAEQSRYHGGPKMFGVDSDGVTLVEEEAAQIRKWYSLILAGGSIYSIRATTGINHASVLAILRNPRNAGLRVLHGQTYPASNPAIVPESTYRAVLALLDGRKRDGHSSARKWIGAGLYECVCGTRVKSSYGGRDPVYRTYFCPKVQGGCGRTWQAERIDDYIATIVTLRMDEPDFADLLVGDSSDEVGSLSTEAAGIRRRLEQLGAEFGDDDDADIVEFRSARTRLRERLAEIEQRQASAGTTGVLSSLAGTPNPGRVWMEMTDVRRRAAVLDALYSVRLNASPRGRPAAGWQPEGVVVMTPR